MPPPPLLPPPPLTNGPGLLLDQLFNLLAPPTRFAAPLRNKDKLSSSSSSRLVPSPSSSFVEDAYFNERCLFTRFHDKRGWGQQFWSNARQGACY